MNLRPLLRRLSAPVPALLALTLAQHVVAQDSTSPTLASLMAEDPKGGFVLLRFNGRTIDEIPLTRLQRQGNRLQVDSPTNPGPVFSFTIRESSRHVSLRLDTVSSDLSDRSTSLVFRLNLVNGAVTAPVDYIAVDNSKGTKVDFRWPYLWNTSPRDPKGAFAIAPKGTDIENDRALAEIWAQEPLPHPAIGRPWTETEVMSWIDRYQKTFAGLNRVTLSAKTPEELSTLTPTIQQMGAKRVYLHTDTWRYHYWPSTNSFVNVNTQVFPKGREDLIQYSKQLHAQGIQLQLHNVSGGIGRLDKEFITSTGVDPRLESWFQGTLVRALGPKDKEVVVSPDN